MFSTPWRLLAFVLTCLALAATTTHVSDLPSQILPIQHALDAQLELQLGLARLGGALGIQSVTTLLIAGLFACAVLCVGLRSSPLARKWTGASAALLAAALITWIVVVMPVGREAERARIASPDLLRAVWPELRDRWEYGHALAFGFQLCALGALTLSVLVRRSERGSAASAGAEWNDRERAPVTERTPSPRGPALAGVAALTRLRGEAPRGMSELETRDRVRRVR